MLERIVIAVALVGLGVLAYRLLLSTQRWQAAHASGRDRISGRPALLVFTSPTCAPCKLQQIPIVDRLMASLSDRIDLRLIDVTEQPDVAAQFGVWSLPTTIVLDDGGRVEAINQGVASEKKLREQVERVASVNEWPSTGNQRMASRVVGGGK